jgi:tetratricopeptide (TPR) repeat protein
MVSNSSFLLVLLTTVFLGTGTAQSVQPSSEQAQGSDAASEAPAPAPPAVVLPATRGDVLMARKQYRDAIDNYEQAIKDVAIIYNKIGIAYHQLMDFKAALQYYQRSLEVNPNYSEAINNIGTVYYAQRKHKRAIDQYKKALKITPNSASIYSNLGTAYFARKNYKEAFEAYQKALSLDPEVFEHRSSQGVLLQERTVEERAKFHFFLAKTYAKAGMADRALLYMRKALEEGFKEREKFETDPDFALLKDLPEFQELLKLEPRVL